MRRSVGTLILIFAGALVSFLLLLGEKRLAAPKSTPEPQIVEPRTHDGKVFFFPANGDAYRTALSAFLKAHPESDCRYFGADIGWDSETKTTTFGHTVVCTGKAISAQEETVP